MTPVDGRAWSPVRESVKHFIELLLLRAGPAHIARGSRTGKSLVLAYHNVIPDGADPGGDRSLHLARADPETVGSDPTIMACRR